jgi:hypothetical protein
MNDRENEPLGPDVQALLDREREAPDPPTSVRDRVLARVQATVAVGTGSGASHGPGSVSSRTASPGMGRIASRFLASRAATTVATFLVGTAAGAGIDAALRRAPEPVVERPQAPQPAPNPPQISPPPVSSSPPGADLPPPAPLPEPLRLRQPSMPSPAAPRANPALPPKEAKLPVPAAPRAIQAPAPSSTHSSDHSTVERSILEQARTALTRGNSAAALDALDRHQRDFPDGDLVEEREALAVQALVVGHEYDEARARGEKFKSRFHNSILMPAVEAALATMP